MKQITVIIFFTFITQILFAQKTVINQFAEVDKKMLALPDSMTRTTRAISAYVVSNFVTTKDRARAIFIWIAANIQYDVENMFAINFYETQNDKIKKALETRKGICENYAALFNDICLKCGIKCFVIEGYTKQNGFADYIPHVWCAALIDSVWRMFDPTWGSGYVNNGKFYKKIDNTYFNAEPSVFIKSHMPFDFLWEFLHYPVTNQEFYDGATIQNPAKPFFDFEDSIKIYESQNHIEQLVSAANRIEKNGVKNSLIFERLQNIKIEIQNDKINEENERQNKLVNLYNAAVANYNAAINDYNAFIDYRNHQFVPAKSDAEIQGMIDTTNSRINTAKTKLDQIVKPDGNLDLLMSQLRKSIGDLDSHIQEQQEWLQEYFSKSKSKRKTMFYERKVTWFGIPLN